MQDIRKRLIDSQQFDASTQPAFPRNMLVELTNACNHQCIFCTNRKMTRPTGQIDEGLLFRVLREAFDLGTREVGFYTTGEPFASPGLPRYVAEAKRLGYDYVYITTNGALASPERTKAVMDAGLDSIKFSINAGERESYARIHGHDDFERVLRNLTFVSEYRKTLGRPFGIYVSCVLTRQTQGERETLSALAGPLADDVLFFNVGNQGGLMHEVNECLTVEGADLERKPPCPMLFNRFHITHEGYLSACCVDYQNYLVVADLNTTPLRDAWHSATFEGLRQKHLDAALEGTLCYNCLVNENRPVQPLTPQYASPYEIGAFSAGMEIRRRLAGASPDCGVS